MTTSQRVRRHRQAEASRRRVTTRGKRVPRPPQRRAPQRRRPKYRHAGALAGLSVLFSTFTFMTGSIFWAVGAATSAAASGYVARQAYKRELAQVKATGKPIQDAKPRGRAGDPLRPGDPKPVDLDKPPARRRPPADAHMARCKANPPGGKTCRCPDGPNRKGKPKTTRASTGARRTKKP